MGDGKGRKREAGVGIRRGVREQPGAELEGAYASSGGDKIHSRSLVHLVRSRGAAAKPRNRALWALYRFSAGAHLQASLQMGANKKTIATVVTTVSRLGGEDKIRTCGRVTPTAV